MKEDQKNRKSAPGGPGKKATWTTGAKSGIGKSINTASDVAFTLANGIVTEVFYPREDVACLRDMECIVTDGSSFFSEEKTDTDHEIEWMDEGVPAFRITNRCKEKKYFIEKEVIVDPIRNTLLQQIRFTVSEAEKNSDFKFHITVSPHIKNRGMGNSGWKGSYKGKPMLFASRENTVLAFATSTEMITCSVGFEGVSDGYTDLKQHFSMEWQYDDASDGNIVLTAQIDQKANESVVVAIGFGNSEEEAANNALSSILDGFSIAKAKYIYEWQRWQRSLANIKSNWNTLGRDFRKSAAILRIHESRTFPGGIIASLSKPWGFAKGDDDNAGGYHLVWPRDLALSSGGFMELETKDDVLRILNYMMTTQEQDGKWSQNMWLAGVPHWTGVQMDQVALPILLVGAAYQKKYVSAERCKRYWPIVKKALSFLLTSGPYTEQDRWEEESGFTPFTLASQIAGLLTGSLLAEVNGETDLAAYCIETADHWNENIEKWTYVTDTSISKELGIEGYYMRINPYYESAEEVKNRYIDLKNHKEGEGKVLLADLVSVDALALVRFGLRAANDPKILNTIKVIDKKLKIETPYGPCWHRYNNDGYGEDADGKPYNGHGIGRAWPLLTGERAHYEIAAGNIDTARALLKAMEAFAENALLPEQIWDTDDIPEKGLYFGRPTGSAMPLTWAHAEYLKLCSSIKHNRIADMPQFTEDRYIKNKTTSKYAVWHFNNQIKTMDIRKTLRIELTSAAVVHWTDDNWSHVHQISTTDCGIGIYYVDINPVIQNPDNLIFTFFWSTANHWEGKDFTVQLLNNG